MHSDAFDVIPFNDIEGNWKKLGSGSFGNVYKGNYLGIDVAIKEVLPSKEYDVAKYFEREWRLMKECRHPNICLFIGLSRAPEPDGRIFIVSEFIDNGNVRLYIHDKNKPFPWRLRMSFATDVARALAYLHTRKCIHRDLKGENLLVTSNGRLKITDFGFARIAARNEEESKRLTFCGTDSYMSPEILLGDEFDLPTDIFSLGIIFCEIASRRLADDTHFKRNPPTFGIDAKEVRNLAGPDCPTDFLDLCLECLDTNPSKRPTIRDILERLLVIEAEVTARPSDGDEAHVGSIKFLTGGKRPTANPRIPSFGMGVGKDIRHHETASDESDDEFLDAIDALSKFGTGSTASDQPLIDTSSHMSDYSTTVIRANPQQASTTPIPSLSSILTIQPSPDPNEIPDPLPLAGSPPPPTRPIPPTPLLSEDPAIDDPISASSIYSIASFDSYLTARSAGASSFSTALATQGGDSTIRSRHGNFVAPLIHRFTLHKPGTKSTNKRSGTASPPISGDVNNSGGLSNLNWTFLFFSGGLLFSKCDVCTNRLGRKPFLVCDDCDFRCHILCGEIAPHNCGLRIPGVPSQHRDIGAISPLSRVKQSASNGAIIGLGAPSSPARH